MTQKSFSTYAAGSPADEGGLCDQRIEIVGMVKQPLGHATTADASTSRAKLSRAARLYSPGTAVRSFSRSTSRFASEARNRSTKVSQPAST